MVYQTFRGMASVMARLSSEKDGSKTHTEYQVGYSLVVKHRTVNAGSSEHNRIASPTIELDVDRKDRGRFATPCGPRDKSRLCRGAQFSLYD